MTEDWITLFSLWDMEPTPRKDPIGSSKTPGVRNGVRMDTCVFPWKEEKESSEFQGEPTTPLA
jgi:hypothetical protein